MCNFWHKKKLFLMKKGEGCPDPPIKRDIRDEQPLNQKLKLVKLVR